MKKAIESLSKNSDVLMIPIILLYWYYTFEFMNPLAVTLLVLAFVQIVIQNKTLGILLASLFSLSPIYLFLTFMNRPSELDAVDEKPIEFSLFILIYLIFTIICCGLMFYKYFNKQRVLK